MSSSLTKDTVSDSESEGHRQNQHSSKRTKTSNSSDSNNVKQNKLEEEKSNNISLCKKNEYGEPYWLLSQHRRLTVRKWRSSTLIDLREYYTGADDKELPGKKGISLSVEQWNQLKAVMENVDQLLVNKGSQN